MFKRQWDEGGTCEPVVFLWPNPTIHGLLAKNVFCSQKCQIPGLHLVHFVQRHTQQCWQRAQWGNRSSHGGHCTFTSGEDTIHQCPIRQQWGKVVGGRGREEAPSSNRRGTFSGNGTCHCIPAPFPPKTCTTKTDGPQVAAEFMQR